MHVNLGRYSLDEFVKKATKELEVEAKRNFDHNEEDPLKESKLEEEEPTKESNFEENDLEKEETVSEPALESATPISPSHDRRKHGRLVRTLG